MNRPVAVEIGQEDLLPPDVEVAGVAKGRRNDTAAHLAGRWCAMGLGESEVLALLCSWNLKNQPPLH